MSDQMKTLLTIALVTGISVAARADEKDQVGRYQLFYGTFVSLRSADATIKEISKSEEKSIFKIDTMTGQVWKLNSVGLGSHLSEEFIPIQTDKP
jgi:hypothetical protein